MTAKNFFLLARRFWASSLDENQGKSVLWWPFLLFQKVHSSLLTPPSLPHSEPKCHAAGTFLSTSYVLTHFPFPHNKTRLIMQNLRSIASHRNCLEINFALFNSFAFFLQSTRKRSQWLFLWASLFPSSFSVSPSPFRKSGLSLKPREGRKEEEEEGEQLNGSKTAPQPTPRKRAKTKGGDIEQGTKLCGKIGQSLVQNMGGEGWLEEHGEKRRGERKLISLYARDRAARNFPNITSPETKGCMKTAARLCARSGGGGKRQKFSLFGLCCFVSQSLARRGRCT